MNKKAKCFSLLHMTAVFVMGGLGYGAIEILWRGATHWSMLLTGGICLLILEQVDARYSEEWLVLRCIRGAMVITVVELAVGLVVNRLLGLAVWDYSEQWGNFAGQICPLYTIYWYFLCYPAYWLLGRMKRGANVSDYTKITSMSAQSFAAGMEKGIANKR